MDVSIIIVNLNTRDLLRSALESIQNGSGALSTETILIDNGSTDGSVEMVRRLFPGVRIIANAKNEGFAAPNNQGMGLSSGRYVFLLNSDAELRPDALSTLVAFMDQHPKAGACGPRLVFPDGRLQRSVKGFPSIWTHVCDMFFLDRIFRESRLFGAQEVAWFDYDVPAAVDHVMAAAFLVRRDVLRSVGVLDESFRIYYNDMDWCYRMRRSGWEIWYVPGASVAHHLGSTVNALNSRFAFFEELYDNTILFHRKRYGAWAVPVYKVLLALGFTLRSAGWTLVHFFRPTEQSTLMRAFSWRSLWYGLRWWRGLKSGDRALHAMGDTRS